MPRRDREPQPLRPAPRRGAGRTSGMSGGSGRGDASSRTRRGLRSLDPFDMSGRKRTSERLRDQEAEPYRYDSNDRQLLIIKIALALWAGLAIAGAFADYQERDVLSRWEDRGFITVPDDRSVDGLLQFGVEQGIDCTADDLGNLPPRCAQIFDFAREMNDAENLGDGLFSGFLFLFVAIALLVASFAYQANRNLLTLKSEGQRFSAVSAMIWLFVPVLNFYKGAQIFTEIWKGSDPDASTERTQEWKSGPSIWWIPAWWLTFAAIVFFGPRTIRLSFGTSALDERLDLAWGLILADLFLIVPAILAYLVMTNVHYRQEKRHEIVGDHLAVPPPKEIKF